VLAAYRAGGQESRQAAEAERGGGGGSWGIVAPIPAEPVDAATAGSIRRRWGIVLHSSWLLGELAKQRMDQDRRDADAWRRVRLAEQAPGPPPALPADGGFARRTLLGAWGMARATAAVLARAVRWA
jgi:hypothetical protein